MHLLTELVTLRALALSVTGPRPGPPRPQIQTTAEVKSDLQTYGAEENEMGHSNLVRAEEDFFGYSPAGERHVWTLSKSHNTYS